MGREELKAGLFTLAALGILSLFLILISGWNPWKEQTLYKTRFRMVLGVNAGTPVRMNGVPIGSVTGLRLIEDGTQVEVTFGLTGDRLLYEGVLAELASASLLGENFLLLTQVRQKGDELEPGSLIPSRMKLEIGETMNAMGRLAGRADAILRDIRIVVNQEEMTALRDNIRRWQGHITRVVSEATGSISGVEQVVSNANRLLINADAAISETKVNLGDTLTAIRAELKHANATIAGLSDRLNKAVDSDQPLVLAMLTDGKKAMADIRASANRISDMTGRLDASMDDIRAITQGGRNAMDGVNRVVGKGEEAVGTAQTFLSSGVEVMSNIGRLVDKGQTAMDGVGRMVTTGETAMDGVGRMVVQGETAMDGVGQMVAKGRTSMDGVGRIVSQGEEAMGGVRRMVATGETAMEHAAGVTEQADEAMPEVRVLVAKSTGAVSSAKVFFDHGSDVMAGVGDIVGQGNTALAGINRMVAGGESAMAGVGRMVDTGEKVMTRVDSISGKVDRAADITLEDLVVISDHLVQASRNLENLTQRLKDNPGLVISPVKAE